LFHARKFLFASQFRGFLGPFLRSLVFVQKQGFDFADRTATVIFFGGEGGGGGGGGGVEEFG